MSNNGNGGNGYRRLQVLLEEKRFEVEALETTLRLLNGKAQHSAKTRAQSTFDQAVTLDTERRARVPSSGKSSLTVQRQRQTLLEQFDTKVPRPIPDGLGPMVRSWKRFGYVKARGDGIVRTGKNFIEPSDR